MGSVQTVRLSGHSDDVVVVNGAINEEWSYYGHNVNESGVIIAFSTGDAVRIRYTDDSADGVWRINIIAAGGTPDTTVTVDSAPVDDEENYSDVLTVTSPHIKWVALVNDTQWAHQ